MTTPELDDAALEFASKVFAAAREGDADALKQWLDQGLPVNLRNHNGDTLLMLASYHEHGIGGGAGHCVDVMDTYAPSACKCQSDYRDGDGQLMVVFAFSRVVWSRGLGCRGLCDAQIKPFKLSKILVVNLQHKFVFTLRNNAQILTYSYIVNINSMSLNDSLK